MNSTIGQYIQSIVNPRTETPLKVTTENDIKRGPEIMKACQWHGAKDMRIADLERPHVTDPGDVVVRVTTATICGSDLHMYLNKIPALKNMQEGDVLGHEGVGIIDEVGPEVKDFKKGDRVVIAFPIACGNCSYCRRQEFSCCDHTNPSGQMEKMMGHRIAGVFGMSHLTGAFQGIQAEYVRVPLADNNLLKLPDDVPDDIGLLLSDIACTGWHGVELGEVSAGQTVVVWGCGPVGLLCQKWSKFRGATRVIAVDNVPHRLDMARRIGEADEVINFDECDVNERLMELVPGGPDVCIDAAGYRFPKTFKHKLQHALKLETDALDIVTEMIFAVRKAGKVVLIGDYFGFGNQFPIGQFMEKGLTMRGGQAFVQKYWHQLLDVIRSGQIDLSPFVTHRMNFDQLPEAWKLFSEYTPGMIKIAIKTPFAAQVPQAMMSARSAGASVPSTSVFSSSM
eukprot:GILJ01022270.1.p1 GENE.GILJ01022270.1~~GILJ01022270.1.p1  ORF type:complete len:453 (-),score=55.73 GILJ01022270.1:11-1369(-)